MDLISKNNIILDKNSASIQILIKIYNFQEKIQKIENYNNILNKIGIVDKIWIQNFKNEFQYEKICHEIKKNKNEEEIINYLKDKIKKENKNRYCLPFKILYRKSNSSNRDLKLFQRI